MQYGIAHTHDGTPPPTGRIVAWTQIDGKDQTWRKSAEALEACDMDGWRGYVCEYPSGKRLETT